MKLWSHMLLNAFNMLTYSDGLDALELVPVLILICILTVCIVIAKDLANLHIYASRIIYQNMSEKKNLREIHLKYRNCTCSPPLNWHATLIKKSYFWQKA